MEAIFFTIIIFTGLSLGILIPILVIKHAAERDDKPKKDDKK